MLEGQEAQSIDVVAGTVYLEGVAEVESECSFGEVEP
jgi:hypothetical protein